MAPYALLNTLVPPSGVAHSVFLPFTPSVHHPLPIRPSPLGIPTPAGRVVTHLVVARGRRIRIYEVREEHTELSQDAVDRARKDGDVVKSELADGQGAGFDMGGSGDHQLASRSSTISAPPKSLRLHFILSHTLHGTITGLGATQTVSSVEDGLSRLVVSYEQAKMALLEWNESTRSLQTVSLHTYERTAQVSQADLTGYISHLRVDPDSRCVILLLPRNALAVLPILGAEADFELEEASRREIPYSPSYVVELAEIDSRINNVRDITFLPGFNSPTIAILYETLQSWANRPEERDTFTLSLHTIDLSSSTGQISYPLIASIPNLPSSSLSLFPCPPQISGVVLLSPNAIIHIDPSGNTVATAVNAYHSHESSLLAETLPGVSGLRLEGAQVVFLEEGRKGLLLLSDGCIRELAFEKEGRMLVRIVVAEEDSERGPSPSAGVCSVSLGGEEGECTFVGSLLGDGSLLRIGRKAIGHSAGISVPVMEPTTLIDEENGMDLDDDLYGPSTTIVASATLNPQVSSVLSAISAAGPTGVRIELCDLLPDHGSLQDIAFGAGPQTKFDAPNDPQLFALAGSGHTSSFNYFHRDMPALKKRKLVNLSSSRGIWSLRVPVPNPSNGRIASGLSSQRSPERDTVLVVDEDHESGHTKILSLSASKNEPQIVRRIPAATVAAGEFFQKTCVAHVTTKSVSLVEGGGRERQSIKNASESPFASASISDPYIFVMRQDGSSTLFVGDTLQGTLSELPVDLGLPRCLNSLIYTDTSGIFTTTPRVKSKALTANDDFGLYGHSDVMDDEADVEPKVASLESTMDSGKGTQWLVIMGSEGRLEIRSLPNLALVFSTAFASLPSAAVDVLLSSADSASELVELSEPPFHQLTIASIGNQSPEPHLLVLTNSGHLTAYSITPVFSSASAATLPSASRPSLQINLVKVLSRVIRPPDDPSSDEPIIPWSLCPFKNIQGHSGLFLTGDLPFWVMKSETSAVTLYSVDERMVHAFTKTTMYGGGADYLSTNDEGCNLLTFPPEITIGQTQPLKRLVSERTYTHVAFDPPSQHVVAAGLFHVPFEIFDEEENRVEHKSYDPKLLPLSERSSLELVHFATGEVIHGYEFADNETILALESVNLETKSVPSGRKDYIAVGTGISRGEDLQARGATYIFEVVEVVPDPNRPQRKYRLKLLCQDDSKGAVTALANINGYLISSMAQKVYIRGFDYDERLLGLAFLDVSIYVTSIRVMKNLILLGDIVRSVTFLAFQENPFKLVALSKDYNNLHVTSADFLFGSGQLGIVVLDDEGHLRIMDFEPAHIESDGGLKLVRKTEIHVGTEVSSVATIARRTTEEELIAPQSQLLLAGVDGSISTLITVPEQIYKRLSLLQGQILRSIQHVSGLNPRAFRIVRNDTVPRPLVRGVLDGDLLYSTFPLLPWAQQETITKQIGTSVDEVLDDLEEVRAVW